MLREYGFVARELRRLGVSFSAEVNVLLGFQGKKTFFLRTLGEAPTLVHFVGHGYPAEGGSLLAWSHWADSATTIDSGDLREYRDSRKLAQLFARGGIAYLSCCFAGWERRHAGLGEDLCSTLLAEGLDVVVASHLPIYEASAGQLAKTFYQWLARLEVDAGTAVIKARRRMARAFDRSGDCALLSWASLRCTGNPLTSLTGGPRIVLPDRGRRPKARAGRPAAASGAVRRDSAPPTRSRESPAITFPPVRPSSASPDANPTTSTG